MIYTIRVHTPCQIPLMAYIVLPKRVLSILLTTAPKQQRLPVK